MIRAFDQRFVAFRQRLGQCTRGSVALIGALSIIVLVGMGAFAVEASAGYSMKVSNQRIADMAALGGALAYNVNNNQSEMQATAKAIAVAQGVAASATTASLTTDATTGKQLVQVSITTTVPLSLGRVLTTATGFDVTSVGMASVNSTTTSAPPCIAALSSAGSYGITLTGGTNISASGCAVNTNSGISLASSSTTIAAKSVAAGKTISNTAWITTSPTPNQVSQNKVNAATDWEKDDPAMKAALCQVNKLTGTSDTDYADNNTACISVRVAPTTPVSNGSTTDWSLTYEAIGSTAPSKYQASAYSCNYSIPAGTYTIRKLTVPGGCSISFATGSTLSFDSIDMSGATMTIGNGDVTITNGFNVNANNPITIGNGNHAFGTITIGGGKKLDVGSGNFSVGGGISVSGGAYLRVGIAAGNTVVIGKTGTDSITVSGGSQVCFTSDCSVGTVLGGIFSVDGNINNTGGGSLIVFPKAMNHVINGDLALSSGATLSPGLYILKGNFTNGTGDQVQGSDVTIALGGTFSFSGGTKLNLAAPSSTSPYGVPNVLFATKSTSATKLGGGATGQYAGLIYAPKSDILLDGGASLSSNSAACLMMIVNTLTLNGGTAVGSSCPGFTGSSSSSSTPNVALFK